MTRLRYIAASFIAPIAALLLPAVLAVSELFAEAGVLPDGSSDDAAMRGAGLFLLLGVPTLYLVGAVFYAAVGHILARLNRLRLRTTVLVSSLAPWLLVAVGLLGLVMNNRNIAQGVLMLSILGLCMSFFATLGAITWWFVAIGRARSEA